MPFLAFLRGRRERRLAAADELRIARRLMAAEVAAFGDELSAARAVDTHVLTDHEVALGRFELAQEALRTATTADEVSRVEQVLNDGRFSLACLLAARDGVAPPRRRDPCFFNPRHGPAAHDVPWTPLGGAARSIAVCGLDQGRLERGEEPATRLIRVGDRYLPWHEAGSSVAAVARHQAHVGRGVATSLTSGHVAEAHARSATGGINSSGGLLG